MILMGKFRFSLVSIILKKFEENTYIYSNFNEIILSCNGISDAFSRQEYFFKNKKEQKLYKINFENFLSYVLMDSL